MQYFISKCKVKKQIVRDDAAGIALINICTIDKCLCPGAGVWGFVVLDASSKKESCSLGMQQKHSKTKNCNDLFEIEITDSRLGVIYKYPWETDCILKMFAGEMCAFRDPTLYWETCPCASHLHCHQSQ